MSEAPGVGLVHARPPRPASLGSGGAPGLPTRRVPHVQAVVLLLVDALPPVGETFRYCLGKRGNLRAAALGKSIMGHGTKPALKVGGLLEQQPDATRIPLRQEVPPAAPSDVAAENLVQLVRRLVVAEEDHERSKDP